MRKAILHSACTQMHSACNREECREESIPSIISAHIEHAAALRAALMRRRVPCARDGRLNQPLRHHRDRIEIARRVRKREARLRESGAHLVRVGERGAIRVPSRMRGAITAARLAGGWLAPPQVHRASARSATDLRRRGCSGYKSSSCGTSPRGRTTPQAACSAPACEDIGRTACLGRAAPLYPCASSRRTAWLRFGGSGAGAAPSAWPLVRRGAMRRGHGRDPRAPRCFRCVAAQERERRRLCRGEQRTATPSSLSCLWTSHCSARTRCIGDPWARMIWRRIVRSRCTCPSNRWGSMTARPPPSQCRKNRNR